MLSVLCSSHDGQFFTYSFMMACGMKASILRLRRKLAGFFKDNIWGKLLGYLIILCHKWHVGLVIFLNFPFSSYVVMLRLKDSSNNCMGSSYITFLDCFVYIFIMVVGSERGVRVNAIRKVLYETLPEPNCQLLKR